MVRQKIVRGMMIIRQPVAQKYSEIVSKMFFHKGDDKTCLFYPQTCWKKENKGYHS